MMKKVCNLTTAQPTTPAKIEPSKEIRTHHFINDLALSSDEEVRLTTGNCKAMASFAHCGHLLRFGKSPLYNWEKHLFLIHRSKLPHSVDMGNAFVVASPTRQQNCVSLKVAAFKFPEQCTFSHGASHGDDMFGDLQPQIIHLRL